MEEFRGNKDTGDLGMLPDIMVDLRPLIGNWITGGFMNLRVEMKIFKEATPSGINGGRISKLWVATTEKNARNRRVVLEYDRGWSTPKKVGEVIAITNWFLEAIGEKTISEIPV